MNDPKQNVRRAAEWLDGKLVPVLGPAPRGPWTWTVNEDEHPGVADHLCPVCHHAMSRHLEVDEVDSGRVFLLCPDAETVMETHHHPVAQENTLNLPVLH